MIRGLLRRISDRLPVREIKGPKGEPYLERYYVGRLFRWTFYLHRIVASDPGKELHDHPWGLSVSLVLAGGYLETRLNRIDSAFPDYWMPRIRKLRPGRFNVIRGHNFHRIDLPPGGDAWTLFVAGRRCRPWGFLYWRTRSGPIAGVSMEYRVYSDRRPTDWHKTASTGAELRRGSRLEYVRVGGSEEELELMRSVKTITDALRNDYHIHLASLRKVLSTGRKQRPDDQA